MITIGLDLSLTGTGIAVWDGDTKTVVDSLSLEKDVAKMKGYPRLKLIRNKIMEVVETHEPAAIVIEDYAMAGKGRITALAELGGIIRFSLYLRKLDVYTIFPSTLKKFITGSGKGGEGSKGRVMLELFKRWGVSTTDNNIADAVGLAIAGDALLQGKGFTQAQKLALDKATKLFSFH